jgi:CDP-diacylglycerol--glycerol-3-phosphate 3-phosphatidyltransferase
MTLSNRMTILRGIASIAFVPMMMDDHQLTRVFALLIFTLAAITDYYDGRLARIRGEKTNFGVIADPIADKFLTSVGLIAVSAIQPDIVPWWMTIVIILREIGITVFRFILMARGRILAADAWGKWKTGLQMTVIPYGLVFASIFSDQIGRSWQVAFQPTFFGQIVYGLGYGLAVVTTALTIWSGILYLRGEAVARPGKTNDAEPVPAAPPAPAAPPRADVRVSGWTVSSPDAAPGATSSPIATMIASAFGAGRSPIAPGTAGSLAALPLAWLSAQEPYWGAVLVAILFCVGIPAATSVARAMGKSDPGLVVIDEVIGMMIASLGVGGSAFAAAFGLWPTLLAAFLLFRFFDILKPPPCRALERLPAGWGIVMDDVAAGLYARLALFGVGIALS